ncbi:hypothetical protein BH20ACI2_BH20ACI2_05270 [soil metagenome]
MKRLNFLVVLVAVLLVSASVFAQKPKPAPAPKPAPIIFAVLNDGKMVEPLAYVEGGKLVQPVSGGEEPARLASFNRTYYKANASYRLIFGGAIAGTVTIRSSDPKAECSANMADVSTVSARAKLRGNVMALATNVIAAKKGSGVRRFPTAAERAQIEALVRSELAIQKVPSAAVKTLRSQNLTALDVDSDGLAELVGTYWVDTSAASRALLFFIADKGSDGKYSFGFTDFRNIKKDDVMSSDITDVDSGVYHERLLDVFDFDNDGVAEVFTYVQSFEGAGFNAYRRESGKWTMIFEGSNYHCGY